MRDATVIPFASSVGEDGRRRWRGSGDCGAPLVCDLSSVVCGGSRWWSRWWSRRCRGREENAWRVSFGDLPDDVRSEEGPSRAVLFRDRRRRVVVSTERPFRSLSLLTETSGDEKEDEKEDAESAWEGRPSVFGGPPRRVVFRLLEWVQWGSDGAARWYRGEWKARGEVDARRETSGVEERNASADAV